MGDDLVMLGRLNEDTRPDHTEADSDLEQLLSAPITGDGYRMYLVRLHGFLIPFEAALAQTPGLEDFIDTRARAMSHLVIRDLATLGMSLATIGSLPRCETIPRFLNISGALGWMYVVERPLLASAVIKGQLGMTLTHEMEHAASYLTGTGEVGASWRELGEAMDTIAVTSQIAERIISAARDGFRCLHRWRTIELGDANQQTVC